MLNNHSDWRYASQAVKFLKLIDYKFFGFALLWILYMSWFTFFLLIAVFFILIIIEVRWKYQLPAVFRRIFSRLSGKFKPAVTNRRRARSDF